ncbi:hypothetical protein [Deinococcus sp. RL]|uniref:hypothetical protein n=1 Tax=Deinococcus sp. RL TaxID=1489678 RepID=UPI000B133A96|nr:hypothetical protein [Deinococcus sp. RL]
MKISDLMDLQQLNDRTGGEMTDDQLETLRDLLTETEYENTEDVPEREWLKMLDKAIEE